MSEEIVSTADVETSDEVATDVVCDTAVDLELARDRDLIVVYADREYAFCGRPCLRRFVEAPAVYAVSGRIAGALLGSTARALARHSSIPVLVVRERHEAPRRILVATDGSPDARAALSALASMPLPDRTEVTLLYVGRDKQWAWPVSPFGDELRAAAEREQRAVALEILRQGAEQLPGHVGVRLEIERGPVTERVIAFAGGMGADLIVLGSRGTTLGHGFLEGSTADRVLSAAHCAVLVARAPAPSERPMREEEVLAATAG